LPADQKKAAGQRNNCPAFFLKGELVLQRGNVLSRHRAACAMNCTPVARHVKETAVSIKRALALNFLNKFF
jgi:hypothetical protein